METQELKDWTFSQTNMSGSDGYTPNGGRYHQEFSFLFLLFNPRAFVPRELVCSKGASILTTFQLQTESFLMQHFWCVTFF
jgi:hypothetical protein